MSKLKCTYTLTHNFKACFTLNCLPWHSPKQAWATGMWHLLAMPARGALRGGLPYALAGLVGGLQDLSLRTTQASLNSSRK